MYNNGYYGYQPQSFNYVPQQTQQFQANAFSKVLYGTIDEAKAYMLLPNESIMIINKELGEFYVKIADSMGKSLLEEFYYGKKEKKSSESVSAELDTKELVKTSDLVNFATKEDLKGVYEQLESIKTQIQLMLVPATPKGFCKTGELKTIPYISL